MKTTTLLSLILAIFVIASCTYKYEDPDFVPAPPIDTTVVISFATQIVPIWNDGNNCTACHKPGGTSPDLTPANAYSQITSKNLVVANDLAGSKIYYFPNPTNTASHTWKKYTSAQAELVAAWINQGAKNN